MLRRAAVALGVLLLMAFGPTGCKQTEGEACQVNSDCKSGLVCCFDSQTGKGTCQDQCLAPDGGRVDASQADASQVDAAPADSEVMDAAPVDAQVVDAGPADAVAADVSPADAQPVDAAPVDAGLVDATVDATP